MGLGFPYFGKGAGEAMCVLPLLPRSSFRDEPMLLPKTPSQRRKLRKRQSSWVREENKELSRRR